MVKFSPFSFITFTDKPRNTLSDADSLLEDGGVISDKFPGKLTIRRL
jgi:hypothetical protein